MNQRQNLAALTTLLLCLIIVILPVTIMTISLLQEGAIVYRESGLDSLISVLIFSRSWVLCHPGSPTFWTGSGSPIFPSCRICYRPALCRAANLSQCTLSASVKTP